MIENLEGKIMKKVLFATTALVATAGVAAADVSFGGYGRFGIGFTEGRTQGGVLDETFVTSRVRLTVDGTTESDNGLSFGVRLRLQQNAGEVNQVVKASGFNAARFHVSAGGLEVGVGNIFGAMDSLPGVYGGSIGLTGLGWGNVVTNFLAHSYSSSGVGQSPEGVEVIYSAGNFTLHVSHGDTAGQMARTEIGGSFNFNDWTIGAGFADVGAADIGTKAVLTIGGSLGAANVGLAFAQNSALGVDTNAITLSGSFEVGAATTVHAYVADDEAALNTTAYGIGVVHNLGGGASIRGGVVDLHGNTRADLGVLFNF
jgi:outer membrane protein OmpU